MRSIAIALLTLSAVAVQAQAPVRLQVQGRVVARGSNDPVPHAQLVAAKVGGTQADYRTATSDAAGRFVFPDLTPGSYRIHADHPRHIRGEYGRTPVASSGTAVVIDERTPAPDLTIMMTPTGVIAGRVTENGRPARNVIVRALRTTYRDGQRSLAMADYAVSDDRGDYRLFGLAPGSYLVSAMPFGRPRLDGDALVVPTVPSNANNNRWEIRSPATLDNVTAAALDTRVYPAVYHPGTTDSTTASALEVAPGAAVLGIDLALTPTATFRVRGRVTTQGLGDAPTRVRVSVASADGVPAPEVPSVDVPAGDFELRAVPPGRYYLSVSVVANPGERAPLTVTRVPVEVWDRDLDGVAVLLQPGVTITGRVLVDGAPSNPDQRPSVQLLGLNGMSGTSARRVEPDGTFVLENVQIGEYRWRVIPVGGFSRVQPWVKTATFGGDDVSGRMIRVGPEATSRKLELEISSRTALLEAVVLDTRRRPMAGVLVIAVPDASRRNLTDAYRSAVTDATGRAKFEGLVPGDYTLFATETLAAESWQDPAVLKRFQPRGEAVRLGEGAVRAVELRITS